MNDNMKWLWRNCKDRVPQEFKIAADKYEAIQEMLAPILEDIEKYAFTRTRRFTKKGGVHLSAEEVVEEIAAAKKRKHVGRPHLKEREDEKKREALKKIELQRKFEEKNMALLGELSAEYESASAGARAIGWDSTGGRSYGTYQLATRRGSVSRFIKFCEDKYPEVAARLGAVEDSAEQKNGGFAREWLQLADEGLIQKPEHDFIKSRYYDRAYKRLDEGPRHMVDNWHVIKDVLWSTAVQHGPGNGRNGASGIFNKSFEELGFLENGPEDFIEKIYDRRPRYFGSSTPQVKSAVRQRFLRECRKALSMLEEERGAK